AVPAAGQQRRSFAAGDSFESTAARADNACGLPLDQATPHRQEEIRDIEGLLQVRERPDSTRLLGGVAIGGDHDDGQRRSVDIAEGVGDLVPIEYWEV